MSPANDFLCNALSHLLSRHSNRPLKRNLVLLRIFLRFKISVSALQILVA
jgi:hypothetical protein